MDLSKHVHDDTLCNHCLYPNKSEIWDPGQNFRFSQRARKDSPKLTSSSPSFLVITKSNRLDQSNDVCCFRGLFTKNRAIHPKWVDMPKSSTCFGACHRWPSQNHAITFWFQWKTQHLDHGATWWLVIPSSQHTNHRYPEIDVSETWTNVNNFQSRQLTNIGNPNLVLTTEPTQPYTKLRV